MLVRYTPQNNPHSTLFHDPRILTVWYDSYISSRLQALGIQIQESRRPRRSYLHCSLRRQIMCNRTTLQCLPFHHRDRRRRRKCRRPYGQYDIWETEIRNSNCSPVSTQSAVSFSSLCLSHYSNYSPRFHSTVYR